MRIAIYSRVSTSHQVEHQTIEQQLDRLTAHVQMHAADGWVLDPTHIFRDEGYSGAVLARPGLDRLRDAVKGHEIDRVLVTTPDRLARNYVHQMVLLEEWARAGCLVEFLDRPMSDDPHDHLLLQIRGAVAEYERTLIAERMRRGRLAKLRAGLLLPWTYPPYGYRLDPDRPRDPRGVMTDAAEAAIVAELFALYRQPGTSLMQLARHLDQCGVPTPSGRPRWSSPTIRGILRNPTYTGQVYAQRTRYRAPTHRRSATHAIGRPHGTATPLPATAWLLVGQVPALVNQAHFDEVQAKLASNRAFARRNNTAHQYLLRALVSCGCCGLACTARAANGRSFYYLCNGKGQGTYSHRATRCAARYIPAKQLDELVWQDLCALLHEPAPLAAAVARAHGGAWLPQELLARRETLRRGQAHLRQHIERLTDAYLRAIIPLDEYERRRSDLERRMQALAGQEALLRNDAARQQELAGMAASLEAFRARVQRGLAEADFERRRQLVMLLVDRVVVTDADVEIRYVLPITPESEHVRFCQLRKDYFENPVQAVLNLPMPADRCCQDLRVLSAAGQEAPDGGFGLTRPIDLTNGFHGQDGLQAGPVAQRFQRGSIRADKHAAPDQAAVAIIKFVIDRPVEGRAAETGCCAKLLDSGEFLPLVRLERHQIIRPSLEDSGGDRPLAAHRIQGDDRPLDVQHVEQFRDRGDLVGFVADLTLAKDQPTLTSPRADDMKRPLLATTIKGAGDCLLVDRHNLSVHGSPERTYPRLEAPLETPSIDQHEHTSEGVMGRDAIGQREKCIQPADLAAAIESDVFPTLGSRNHRTDRDHQDINQPVLDFAATAGVFQDRKFFHQSPYRHAGLPISRRPLEPHQIPCRQISRRFSCVTPALNPYP